MQIRTFKRWAAGLIIFGFAMLFGAVLVFPFPYLAGILTGFAAYFFCFGLIKFRLFPVLKWLLMAIGYGCLLALALFVVDNGLLLMRR